MTDYDDAMFRINANDRRAAWAGRRLTDPNKPTGKQRPWGYPKSMTDAQVRAAERGRARAEKQAQAERLAALRARKEQG
jgi:hypothetical protein